MPSTSKAQARTMRAAAHNPTFAAKVGIPKKTAMEFMKADMAKPKRAMAALPARAAPPMPMPMPPRARPMSPSPAPARPAAPPTRGQFRFKPKGL